MWSIDTNTLILLAIALLNCLTALFAFLTRQDMKKVEIATNSMKDALVVSTAKASLAEGKELGRAEGEQKAEVLAAGQTAPVEIVKSIPLVVQDGVAEVKT